MKRLFISFLIAGLPCTGLASAADPAPAAAPAAAPATAEPKSDEEKTFYALGLMLAMRGQLSQLTLSPTELSMLEAGIADEALGHTPKLDVYSWQPKIQTLANERVKAYRTATSATEKKKGKAYLETIAAKPGVRKTGTGLLMETIAEGSGAGPSPSESVRVKYTGKTVDGKVFDSSEMHGGTSTFRMQQLAKCWQEGLQFMKPGGKAKLYCPSDLAYGDEGHGSSILPGMTLVFDLELIEVVK